MSNLCWEAPCNILCEAERIVDAHSPYAGTAEWAATKRVHAAWCEPIIEVMQALPVGSRVLDIGPGYGALAAAATVLGHEVQCVELFLQRLEWPGVSWWRGDICEPDLCARWEPFDLCIMAEVLEHLNTDPAEAFANVAQALKPAGVFIGSTPMLGVWPGPEPCRGDLPKWTPEVVPQDRHVRLYSQSDVAALLADDFCLPDIELLGNPPYRYLWRTRKLHADPQRLCTDDHDAPGVPA